VPQTINPTFIAKGRGTSITCNT